MKFEKPVGIYAPTGFLSHTLQFCKVYWAFTAIDIYLWGAYSKFVALCKK